MMMSRTTAAGITAIFGGWAILYSLFSLWYIANVIVNKDKRFEVRVRLPTLTIIELLVLQLGFVANSLREIFVAYGWSLPHEFTDLAFTLITVSSISAWPYRVMQMLVVFDDSFRRSYYRWFRSMRYICLIWSIIGIVVLYVPLTLGYKGCIKM